MLYLLVMNESKIKSKIKEVAERNDVKSAYQLQKVMGLLSPTVALRLWNNEVTRFSVEILENLCEKFNCEVGDLLVYESDTVAPSSPKANRAKPQKNLP